jgi:hypothetical protein
MKAIQRLYKYIDYKGVKPAPFEKEIGLSNGYLGKQLNRNADLGEGILIKVIENCPEINPEWLLTGKGSMLKSEIEHVVKGDNLGMVNKLLDENNDLLRFKVRTLEKELLELKNDRQGSFLYSSVAKPAPQLTDENK